MASRSIRHRLTGAAPISAAFVSAVVGWLALPGCHEVTTTSSTKSAAAPLSSHAERISYNEHIQPILAENCFQCHGPDSASRKGKLRLDRFEFATAPRPDASPAIVPGKVAESALV